MYSQNQEEHYIIEHFKHHASGRFLDIGAYDGKTFSNTFALAVHGWDGVCVEPSPGPFLGMMKAYEDKPNIKLVNAAVSYKGSGLIEFADSDGDAVSTTSKAHEAQWSKVRKFQHIYVNTISVGDIMHTFGEHYDFLSLDVEGTNVEILKTIPLAIMNPSLICIEHESRFDEILGYCKGYSEIHRNGENLIMKRNDD